MLGVGIIASILLCLITWNRIGAYNAHYHLPESKYSKLFRVLTKEHIAIAYTFAVVLHAIITLWFLWDL